MVRWTNLLVLFTCLAMPMLAQVSSAERGAGAAEQTPAAPSTAKYPLDSFPDFSALMMGSRAEPGEGSTQGHIYRSGRRMRMEEPGGHGYFITDLNSGETYGILEAGCIHDDHPYIRAIPFYVAGKADATVTRAPGERETLDGHSCQIEDITVSSPSLANPQKMRLWEAEDLGGFPIKIEFLVSGGHGPVIRYKNVVPGPQDSTLFFHPKSCHPLPQEPPAPPAHKDPPGS
jgi:hypothetical protein